MKRIWLYACGIFRTLTNVGDVTENIDIDVLRLEFKQALKTDYFQVKSVWVRSGPFLWPIGPQYLT
jgi:hypothetical protein